MILGIGTDLCEVSRIEAAVERTGERFLERVFTPAERLAAQSAPRPGELYARAFALKEATFKALGRGWPDGIGFDEVELCEAGARACEVRLHARAAQWASRAGIERFHAATSCDEDIAAAVVIAEDR